MGISRKKIILWSVVLRMYQKIELIRIYITESQLWCYSRGDTFSLLWMKRYYSEFEPKRTRKSGENNTYIIRNILENSVVTLLN